MVIKLQLSTRLFINTIMLINPGQALSEAVIVGHRCRAKNAHRG